MIQRLYCFHDAMIPYFSNADGRTVDVVEEGETRKDWKVVDEIVGEEGELGDGDMGRYVWFGIDGKGVVEKRERCWFGVCGEGIAGLLGLVGELVREGMVKCRPVEERNSAPGPSLRSISPATSTTRCRNL